LLDIEEPVYSFNQKFVPQDKAPEIVERLSQIEGIACTYLLSQLPGLNDIHVTNRNATKEHAVTELLQTLKVSKEDAIGVGDGHNDIHLFNAVGHRVAMSNAVADLKTNADEIIGDVKEDGLAAYLELLAE
jgi:HAD superfamily hydrolase (TIGR01484 family)